MKFEIGTFAICEIQLRTKQKYLIENLLGYNNFQKGL